MNILHSNNSTVSIGCHKIAVAIDIKFPIRVSQLSTILPVGVCCAGCGRLVKFHLSSPDTIHCNGISAVDVTTEFERQQVLDSL